MGGGMGRTYQVPTTYPRLASLIGFIPADRVIACSDAVMAVQRDYGDRKERLYARFKYTVDAKGLDWIKAEIEQRMGEAFELARPFHFESNGDRYGWTETADSRHHLTLFIENGRLRSEEHTSELQSLMSISYAVSCLKQKNKQNY